MILEQPNGKSVALRDLQLLSLEMLKDFDVFCNEHNISYSFCGGCCIGTLRHKGFIPWDDDVDVHMLRPDYERFANLWNDNNNTYRNKYDFIKTTEHEFADTMLTQIGLKGTTFIKENQKHLDISHTVRLEIIPLDGAPTSNFKRKIQLMWALTFYLFNRGFSPENRGKLVHSIGNVILKVFNTPKKRVKIWKFAEKQMTKYSIDESEYVTELCVTWKYMKLRYPKEIFQSTRLETFEELLFPIPIKAEEYLTMAFGDYMSLPSEEEQIPKHEAILIDLDKDYKEYKGEYYG